MIQTCNEQITYHNIEIIKTSNENTTNYNKEMKQTCKKKKTYVIFSLHVRIISML
jgi:hypothetical protein